MKSKGSVHYCRHDILDTLNGGSLTTQQVADKVGCEYLLAYRRLKDLLKEDPPKVSVRVEEKRYVWSRILKPQDAPGTTIIG